MDSNLTSADNDQKCELPSITAKVKITSLDSHFPPKKPGTECGGFFKIAKVWIKVCNDDFQESGGKVHRLSIKNGRGIAPRPFTIVGQE